MDERVLGHFCALSKAELGRGQPGLFNEHEVGMKHCPRAVSIARPSTLRAHVRYYMVSHIAAAPPSSHKDMVSL